MKKYNFNFTGKFPIAVTVSSLLVIASIFLFVKKGLNYGVDFRGGSEVQVKFSEGSVNLSSLRDSLKESGFNSSQVQSIGDSTHNEYLIKVSSGDEDLNIVTDKLTQMLQIAAKNHLAS